MVSEPFSSRDKAVEFDYNGLLSPTGKSGLFCLSETTWQLCYNLIQGYGTWRSRYFVRDEDTGEPLTITDEEFSQVVDLIDIATEELIMPCELGPAIEKLGEMILELGNLQLQVAVNGGGAGGDCGCPPGGLGNLPPGGAPDQNEPGSEEPPPDGFDTWVEYLDYKCRAANKITDDLIASTGNLGSLYGVVGAIQAVLLASFLNTSLLGGVLAGVMAIGFSEFAAAGIIIAALVALIVASVGGLVWFSTLAANMEDNKTDLICALYHARTTDIARQAWSDFITARIGAASGAWSGEPAAGLISSTMDTVLNALNNLSVVNLLFEPNDEILAYSGSVDCETCVPGGCPFRFQVVGSDVLGSGSIRYDGIPFTVSSGPFAGFHLMNMITDCGFGDCPEAGNWCVEFISTTIVSHGSFTRQIRSYNSGCGTSLSDYPGSFFPLGSPMYIGTIETTDDSPFTITMRITQRLGPTSSAPSATDCS